MQLLHTKQYAADVNTILPCGINQCKLYSDSLCLKFLGKQHERLSLYLNHWIFHQPLQALFFMVIKFRKYQNEITYINFISGVMGAKENE